MEELHERSVDVSAEQAVLGAMMLPGAATPEIVKMLEARDFYKPAHEMIFLKIVEMYSANQPVDAVTLGAALGREFERLGGLPYLHTLMSSVPTSLNGPYYAEIVSKLAEKRRLAEAGTRIRQMGMDTDINDLGDILGKAFETLRAVPSARIGEPEGIPEVLGRVLDNMDNPTEDETYRTGVKSLDSIYRGGAPGRLDVFAARPAVGKSVMAINIINENCVEKSRRTLLFSLEMSAEENTARLLSRRARVNLHRILDPVTHPPEQRDWERIALQVPLISNAPLVIVDTPMNLTQMAAKIREEIRKGLKIVIVDYLQLMPDAGKPESRQVAVSRNIDGLKLLAREYGISVIALAQLNRKSTERMDGVPRISDLRESGAIEQSADTVILIHRPDQEEPESPRAGEADLILAKQRNGPTGIAVCVFQGHYARFVDFAPEN